MNTFLRWSNGNEKLKKTRTVSFNLPAFRSRDGHVTCPMAGICAGPCYARQGRIIMPQAQNTREFNLAIARADLPAFERYAVLDLARIRTKSIRVHDSGDFYSQAYLDSWLRIMRQYPQKRFYAYTKCLHLDWSQTPPNFQVVYSLGGKLDHLIDLTKPHARIFATHDDRKQAGYVDGNKTDRPAQRGEIKIGLVYHGTRNLTPAQTQSLTRQRA